MPEDAIQKVTQPMSALAPKDSALIRQKVDKIFEADLKDGLHLAEQALEALDAQTAGNAFVPTQTALQSTWNLLKGIRLMQAAGNYVEAVQPLKSATNGFDSLGFKDFRDVSIGLTVYCTAVDEIQHANLGRGQDLLAQVKKYLEGAGKFGSTYEVIIDVIEAEALFLSAINSLTALDFATARTIIDRAAQSAEKVARNYYQPDEVEYNQFMGMARFYRAYYTYRLSISRFNQFEYDRLATDKDLLADALKAKDLLATCDIQNNGVIRNVLNITEAIIHLLELLIQLSPMMQQIFSSTFKPDLLALMDLRKKIDEASSSASAAGPQFVSTVRVCDQLTNLVNNLERLAKPSKKDFGAFSGLVACALFLPLFLVISWANSSLGIGLKGASVVTPSLVLALIGGFGFGALRFRSMIFPKGGAT